MKNNTHITTKLIILFYYLFSFTSYSQLIPQLNLNSNDSLIGFNEEKAIQEIHTRGIFHPKDFAYQLSLYKKLFIAYKYNLPLNRNKLYKTDNTNTINSSGICANVDFESGDLSGWIAKYGYTDNCLPFAAPICPSTGIVTGRHTIVSSGFDPIVGGALLSTVAPGSTYSLLLGNDNTGSEVEQVEQTITITSNNAIFSYKYAVVLEDPGHPFAEQPRFQIQAFDASTGILINCGQYDVSASQNLPGFQTLSNGVIWKNWTTEILDLTSMIGKNVTIRFTIMDCAQGAHFGYAYIDGQCLSSTPAQSLCDSSKSVALTAPSGTLNYKWESGETTQSIQVTSAGIYTVSLISSPGCVAAVKYQVGIQPSPNADFIAHPYSADILDPTITFANLTPNISSMTWDFGDGDTLHSNPNPAHSYPSIEKAYDVTLIVANEFGCEDSITKTVTITDQPSLYIPNAFTPNGDGENDYFYPKYWGYREIELWIFDRFGEMIWYTNELNKPWDGNDLRSNKKAQIEVYTYKLAGLDKNNNTKEIVGSVTVLR